MEESYSSRRHIIGWVVKAGWEKVMFELGRNREKGPQCEGLKPKGARGREELVQMLPLMKVWST